MVGFCEFVAEAFLIVEGVVLIHVKFDFLDGDGFVSLNANIIKYWMCQALRCGPSEVWVNRQKVLENFFKSFCNLLIFINIFRELLNGGATLCAYNCIYLR